MKRGISNTGILGGVVKALLVVSGLLFSQPVLAQSSSPCDGTPSCVEDLANVVNAMADGTMPFFATAAATAARRMDEAHDKAIEERGYGVYYGNRLKDATDWPGAIPLDCTSFVLEILKQAFKAAGMQDEWSRVFAEALKNSGSSGFKGIELMKSLERSGWSGHYWNPDVKNPRDNGDEHPWSYVLATRNDSYYGLPVDMGQAIINYNLTDSDEPQSSPGMEALKEVPFALLAAKGGMHMGAVIYGQVYEFHWSTGATSKAVITAVPLTEWDWLSGAVVVPPGTWPEKTGS